MSITRNPNDEGNGFIIAYDGEEVEYGDAIKHFSENKIKVIAAMRYELCLANNPVITKLIPAYFFINQAKKDWEGLFKGIVANKIPDNFISLFGSTSKAEQEKLLRDQSLTTDQYGALLFRSSILGYTYSSYKSEKLPNGIKANELPTFIRVDNGKVTKRGATPLTDGQLKGVILQRKVIVARILDKGNEWHCFFQTFKSIRGEESWRGGQPHIHYISDKWGIPRAELVKQIKAGHHPSTKIHIALHRDVKDEKAIKK